jgi:hypothetical protein
MRLGYTPLGGEHRKKDIKSSDTADIIEEPKIDVSE